MYINLKGKKDTLKIDEVSNLLLNMSGGLLPEHLTKREVELFKERLGEDWFTKLGYREPEYKRPQFKGEQK